MKLVESRKSIHHSYTLYHIVDDNILYIMKNIEKNIYFYFVDSTGVNKYIIYSLCAQMMHIFLIQNICIVHVAKIPHYNLNFVHIVV